MAQKLAGVEVGMMLGWMSTRVLGQYDLLIIEEESPLDQDLVYYVGPNVLALEKQFAFPPREFRLWLALHEVTHRAQFTGIEWMRPHFLGLVSATLDAVDPDPKRLLEVLGRLAESLRKGANPLADGGIMALMASAEQREVLDQVSGLMSLLEGHGDITMDRAGRGLVPSADRFSRVLRQRRESTQGVARLLQQLIGLEAKLNQYAQGERFIIEVERVGGRELLERGLGEARPAADPRRDPQPVPLDRAGRPGAGRLSPGPCRCRTGSSRRRPRDRSRPDWSKPQDVCSTAAASRPPGTAVTCGVSGGADSLALLALAVAAGWPGHGRARRPRAAGRLGRRSRGRGRRRRRPRSRVPRPCACTSSRAPTSRRGPEPPVAARCPTTRCSGTPPTTRPRRCC